MMKLYKAAIKNVLLGASLLASPGLSAEVVPEVSAAFDFNRDYWETTVNSKNYDSATATDPEFSDKVLWPNLTGKEAFAAEKWEKASRTVTWAFPGEDGGKKGHNPFDVASWLVDGEPAGKTVGHIEELFGETVDVVIPESEKPYRIDLRQGSHGVKALRNQVFRHITVGKNAYFKGGGDGVGRTVHGNIWVKRGGMLYGQGSMRFMGGKNTFLRNENGWGSPGGQVSQYFRFEKSDASVEILGDVQVLDELFVTSGMAIVGVNSRMRGGRHARPIIEPKGTLAVLNGGIFGKWQNDFYNVDFRVQGTLLGGLPDRPLTRDAFVTVSFKNHTDQQYSGPGGPMEDGKPEHLHRYPSMVIEGSGTVKGIIAPGSKAKFHLTSAGPLTGRYRPLPESEREEKELNKNPTKEKFFQWYDALPRGNTIFVDGGATIENVHFNHLAKGGLLVKETGIDQQWREVTFGSENGAQGNDLFTVIKGLDRNGRY
ncbi:MAG: hypothetical protein P1U90_05380 [Akkermansiaceae bacterium]|nr:hypothetical protein [Akkermansiaceae bacterium]